MYRDDIEASEIGFNDNVQTYQYFGFADIES